ncbi:hypothetical protein ACWGCW_28125 [Streptomyces sp. NPDC054933]
MTHDDREEPGAATVNRWLLEMGAAWRRAVGMDDQWPDARQLRFEAQELAASHRLYLKLARSGMNGETAMWLGELTPEQIERLITETLTDDEQDELTVAVRAFADAVSVSMETRPLDTLGQLATTSTGRQVTEGILLAAELQQVSVACEKHVNQLVALARLRYLDRTVYSGDETGQAVNANA